MADHILIECPDCKIVAHVEPIGEYHNENPYDWMDANKFYFTKCPTCSQPIVMEAFRTIDMATNEVEWHTPVRLYPVSSFHVNPVIPEDIKTALTESIKCYESSLYTPTVIMCRRTLEGFCQIMGIKKNVPLVKALAKLKEDGIINEQLYQWATLLRDSGNQAAHDIQSSFSADDAKDILDFTIAILDFSYSFKDKFDKFIKRQKQG
jgi:hypothetical protein